MAFGGTADERVGKTLRGKWKLDALLGVGGMAAVYAATHRNGGRAAVKMLHPELASMVEIKNRFVREGYLANRVGHPAVVKALDDDIAEDGTPFLVMELVDGETLEARVVDELMTAEELLAVAEQVLSALSAGHQRGIIHQDLKPANLLVDNDGRVRVLDYGIARSIDDDPTKLKVRATGTPSFMSPEQVRGDAITDESDLYSLGATLFALATGRPPHIADTPMHLMLRIATERAPKLSTLAPELPEQVYRFVDRALETNPERRWGSADEMLAEIQRIRSELGIASSELVLACRHVATQPQMPSTRIETDSVRAIVVSTSTRRIDPVVLAAVAQAKPKRRGAMVAMAVGAAALIVAGVALSTEAAPRGGDHCAAGNGCEGARGTKARASAARRRRHRRRTSRALGRAERDGRANEEEEEDSAGRRRAGTGQSRAHQGAGRRSAGRL
jgi:eukaryotic-like serine/threonine-protein kinase